MTKFYNAIWRHFRPGHGAFIKVCIDGLVQNCSKPNACIGIEAPIAHSSNTNSDGWILHFIHALLCLVVVWFQSRISISRRIASVSLGQPISQIPQYPSPASHNVPPVSYSTMHHSVTEMVHCGTIFVWCNVVFVGWISMPVKRPWRIGVWIKYSAVPL